jgi:hypothetical protein
MGDYVYIQCEVPITLDVKVKHIILWMKDLLPSGVLLKIKDG